MSLEVSIKKKLKGFSLDVSFVHEGRCMGILGASGCGKSMTLQCIAGIVKPDTGRIILNDNVLFDSVSRTNKKPQLRKVGYLFQNYALFPNMTVKENIGVGVQLHKEKKAACIREYLERFHLSGLENRYPTELSGGQQQRVALARILAYYPDMIMLDEPFSALDSFLKDSLQRELLDILGDYSGDVIIVSHSRDEIYKFCDRLTVMDSGKQLLNGNTRDIFARPRFMKAARLTGCKNISQIKRLGEYELIALDWDIIIRTAIPIGENVKYVGIRAHSLQPSFISDKENTLSIQCIGQSESPFENEYLLQNKTSKTKKELWWKIAKQSELNPNNMKSFPEYITFLKEDLMLLE